MSATATHWADDARHLMNNYRRLPIALASGHGSWVVDTEGREYLDLVGGLAVSSLGHAHPAVVEAIAAQSSSLIHASNLYHSLPQVELARLLVEHSAFDRVFLCNSGLEANEAATKLARKWGKRHRRGAYRVVTAERGFHGRSLAMTAATGTRRYQEPFDPMPDGFVHVPYGDVGALERVVDDSVVAVMLEVVQGEGGVWPAPAGYLEAARRLCSEREAVLIFDEVQTGVGRLGTLWGHEAYGVVPDVMTLAKGLAGGLPIGALLAKRGFDVLEPGDHGSTFGGNPVACAAATAVLRHVTEGGGLEHVRRVATVLEGELRALAEDSDAVTQVRGRGLMWGIGLAREIAPDVVNAGLAQGVLVNATDARTLRLLPPLILAEDEAIEGVQRIRLALDAAAARGSSTGSGTPVTSSDRSAGEATSARP